MENSLQSSSPYKLGDKTFFCILFLYQLFFIFQGLDFNDEGFHLTFYQEIFREPQSVQYNFMYWFSGIVGGSFVSLFPGSGILGVRLFAVIMQTATIFLVYRLLKKYLTTAYLQLGLLIALLMLSDDTKDLFYDNVTSLLYVCTAVFIFRGVTENKALFIFLAGLFCSLNFFTRLPNVLSLGLGLVIIYYAFLTSEKPGAVVRKLFIFIGGFALATGAVLLFMKGIGHLHLFIDNIKLVVQMGKSQENTHGLMKLLPSYIFGEYGAFKSAMIVQVAVVVGATILNIAGKKFNTKYVSWILGVLFFFVLAVAARKHSTDLYFWMFTFVAGIVYAATLWILLYNPDVRMKILMLTGCLMLLILPFGSDYLYSSERYAFWFGLPIAINYFFTIRSVSISSSVQSAIQKNLPAATPGFFGIGESQLASVRHWGTAGLIVVFLYYSVMHTWSDSRDRTKMVYAIHHPLARGIFTTKERADAVNELLSESSKYIKKGDYVLAYDVIPMFHYLTETKPFMYNSWPWLFDRSIFKSELYRSFAEKKIRPVVVLQKVNTVSSHNWPSVADDNKDWDIDQPRNAAIKEFLANYQYKKVWENMAFSIYVPQ